MPETIRRFFVALKRKPQNIPLVAVALCFIWYSFNLSETSFTTTRLQGSNMGLTGFAIMLCSTLAMVCCMNAFPYRKKVKIPMLVLLFVMLAIVTVCDIHYLNCIREKLSSNVIGVVQNESEIRSLWWQKVIGILWILALVIWPVILWSLANKSRKNANRIVCNVIMGVFGGLTALNILRIIFFSGEPIDTAFGKILEQSLIGFGLIAPTVICIVSIPAMKGKERTKTLVLFIVLAAAAAVTIVLLRVLSNALAVDEGSMAVSKTMEKVMTTQMDMRAHLVMVAVAVVLVATLPAYRILIRKIDTSVEVAENAEMEAIDISGE